MNMKTSSLKNQSGNTVVIVLVILVVVAVGALAFLSGKMANDGDKSSAQMASKSEATKSANKNAGATETASAEEKFEIKPGNPVVARVGGEEIKRADVISFVQTLPEQTRELPPQKLFPLALDQVINARIVAEKTKDVDVSSDPEYKKQLDVVKKQLTQRIYVENKMKEKLTDERLRSAYDQYVANFPKVEEVRAAHILIKGDDSVKAKAEEVLGKLNSGEDFAALAKEYSDDNSAENGGDLGYFLKTDVVPEFGDSAFALQPGETTTELVKTQFGYHIIKVVDKRMREPVDYDTAKPLLEAQLRQVAFEELMSQWRKDAKVERFDINGEPLKNESTDG